MHIVECIAIGAAAAYGSVRALGDALGAWRRRRERKRGVSGPLPTPAELYCPTIWCIGHMDNAGAHAYRRGHPQPCWDGTVDPRREERR